MSKRGIYVLSIDRERAIATLADGEQIPVTNWVTRGEECAADEATSCVIGPIGPRAEWAVMAGKAFAEIVYP